MARPRVDAGGGFRAIAYTLRKGREAGGAWKLYRRLRSRNTCKTCAFGMGGQAGGMVNEAGSFPEVCKKSIQAVAGDMQAAIDEAFFREHSIEDLGRWTPREMETAGRLAFPIVAGPEDTHFRRIGWDEALDRVGAALAATPPERAFVYGSGRSSNEAAFLMQTFARVYGTPNVHNCSSYCHQASGVALTRAVGSGTATVVLDDLDRADCAVVIGANPASNHPRLIVKLVELRARGGTVIVINPVRELGLERFRIPSKAGSLLLGSTVSDFYVQPNVGGDIAVLKGVLKALLAGGHVDRAFLDRHVEGFEAVERDVSECPWDTIEAAGGVERSRIERIASLLAAARNGIVLWAMGLTHHEHGVDNVLALVNVALARGWVGRPGCGLLPIRGHSNVQGVGSVGFSPAVKTAFAEAMERHYGVRIPAEAGLDTYGSMAAAHRGEIDAAILLGGNLWGSNPDLAWAGEALRGIAMTASITTKLNPGHVHGRGRTAFVLPVLARDEEAQATTQESMFNLVRLSDGGEAAPSGELKSEVEVVCALAARVLPPGPFPFERMTDHRAVREAIARVVPGWDAIARIDDSREEFHIEGRTFHTPRFATPSGKARAITTPLPRFTVRDDEFRLMTFRSEGQFNTVVYEEDDLYRGVDRRDVVLIHRDDLDRLGLAELDPVTVETEAGTLDVVVATIDIAPGSAAMYYPEANALVPRKVDTASGTPAFKSIVARIRRRNGEPLRSARR